MTKDIKTYSHEHTYGSFDLQFEQPKSQQEKVMTQTAEAREAAQVQAAYVIAKKFPRNEHEAYTRIMETCKRPSLAEQSTYAYPRGGKMVTGASIRLAEALSQAWGNLDCGIRELSQENGSSVCEAYAIDLQTNSRVTKVFHVAHKRDTKKGTQRLTDSRDIYELVANQGARRLRACILAIIPGDIVEAAVAKCAQTLECSDVPRAEQIKKLLTAFDEYGIKVEHIEKRLGHNLDAIIAPEIVALKAVYRSIRDGMGKREEFFDIVSTKAKDTLDDLKDLVQSNTGKREDYLKKLVHRDDVKNEKVDKETGEVEESSVFGDNDREVERLTKGGK